MCAFALTQGVPLHSDDDGDGDEAIAVRREMAMMVRVRVLATTQHDENTDEGKEDFSCSSILISYLFNL